MIDTTLLRDNPQKIAQAAKDKRIELNTEHIAHIDAEYRKVLVDVQTLRESRNRFAKDRDIEAGKRIKGELDQKEKALEALKQELDTLLLTIPNPAKDDVKVGKDDTENDVIRTYKTPTEFTFPVKDHLEIGEYLNMIDMERAAKVSGARFVYLKNDGVLLELALIQFALKTLMKEGFTPVITPDLIKKETMQGLGYMENGGDEDMFQIPSDDLVLVGTAEHA
ncbi:MAG: seryl-tRNA synthetase, partial [Patescibacteria group bacterium]|nr:seryl-tRNA synthetase [Patescibacteria group bacterium]